MRFVHTADWQLGMTRHFLGRPTGRPTGRPAGLPAARSAGLPAARPGSGAVASGATGEAQARFAAARLDAVRALGALADAEGAAFVVVCGDVFESNLVGTEVVARTADALRSFRTPVLLLPGNHDPADAASVLRRPGLGHVTVLDTPGVHRVAEDVEVVAAPWTSKRPLTDLVAAQLDGLAPAPPGTVRVAVGHGSLDVLRPDPTDPAVVRLAGLHAALDDGRVHYVALGDRHSTWSDATGRVRYSGAPEVTDHDETDPGNVLVVDVDAEHVEVRAERVGRWRFVRHEAAVDTDADLDTLDAWLAGCPDKERTAVRFALVGTLTLRQRVRLDDLLAAHALVFAALETSPRRSHLVTRPDDADLGSLDLSGFAATAARELHDAARAAPLDGPREGPLGDPAPAGTADDAEEARDALGLLHRLAAPGPPR